MFDEIEITSYEQNLKVMSDGLKWNNKTEQLTSPKDYSVTITNDISIPDNAVQTSGDKNLDSKMLFTGKGFSASGVSNKYSFGSKISGKIDVKSGDVEPSDVEDVEPGGVLVGEIEQNDELSPVQTDSTFAEKQDVSE